MNKALFQKVLPHLIALVTFVVVALLFCRPALEGKVLEQHDIVQSRAMSQEVHDVKASKGYYPLWNTHMFSGMPNYQILIAGPSVLPNLPSIMALGLPRPLNFFFLACLGFYILCMAFRLNPYVGIFAALAFAYSTYDPVIINAGHETKMLALAFAPGFIAGLVWIYEKKYWIGLAVAALFATLQMTANHPQITYYLMIIIGAMTISYLVTWIINKQWKHTVISLSMALLSVLVGIGTAAVTLFTTYDYAKYTMRGGKSIENTGGKLVEKKTKGLDLDYAMQYSYSKAETATLLMPHSFGGSSRDTYADDSKMEETLAEKNIPEGAAAQLAGQLPKYWGGLESTSGPFYFGAVVCLLCIAGLVCLRTPHRWWIGAAIVLSLILAWGKYLAGVNTALFNLLPFYNKFRTPSMALVIAQLLVPLMAGITLQGLLFSKREEAYLPKNFKKILFALGGVVVAMGLVYLFNDYHSPIVDPELTAGYGQQAGPDVARNIISALMVARKAMFGADVLRLAGFAILVAGLFYLWRKKIVSPLVALIILLLVNTIDLFMVGQKYLNEENYVDAETYTETNYALTEADRALLKDTDPHYRVLDLTANPFSDAKTSYYHRSLGGYHPAKLRIYQDLIENQFVQKLNMPVLHMLDTRYLIVPDQTGKGPATVQKNDSALGGAWFVKEIKPADGQVAEMNALSSFNPRETAFFDQRTEKITAQPQWDSSAKISLTAYGNDTIRYSTSAKTPQFAVLSEIYYPSGWNAYIDGQKTAYFKVNYLLRGLPVPAGNHTIEFRFEPASYKTGYQLALISGIILYLLVIGGLVMHYKTAGQKEAVLPSGASPKS